MSGGTSFTGSRGKSRYDGPRRRMVQTVADNGVKDLRVLHALDSIPRHLLVPEALRDQAYKNTSIPIGENQTISQPEIVAAMSEALELKGDEVVLEVGTGSGYQAAVLSRLADRVISIERIPKLAARARSALDLLGVNNVVVHLGDGSKGRLNDGPFDAIIVTAGGPEIPKPLLEQLAPGGRLVGPFGPRDAQSLIRVRRTADGELVKEVLGKCRFVDLIGQHGWGG